MPNSILSSTSNCQITEQIVSFLRHIGLEVRAATLGEQTFLPGIQIEQGVILYDLERLKYPGDLLHEAGHLAVIPPAQRQQVSGDVGSQPHEEMMAIAWSYAAAVKLGLEPTVVFHDAGYRGGSATLIENFTQGRYFGVPTLQWLGLTVEGKTAQQCDVEPFPHMLKWLLD